MCFASIVDSQQSLQCGHKSKLNKIPWNLRVFSVLILDDTVGWNDTWIGTLDFIKIIIDKFRGEVFLLEQDKIENVS